MTIGNYDVCERCWLDREDLGKVEGMTRQPMVRLPIRAMMTDGEGRSPIAECILCGKSTLAGIRVRLDLSIVKPITPEAVSAARERLAAKTDAEVKEDLAQVQERLDNPHANWPDWLPKPRPIA